MAGARKQSQICLSLSMLLVLISVGANLPTNQGRSQGGAGGARAPPKSGGSQKYIRGDPCDLGSEAKNRGSGPPPPEMGAPPPPKPNPGYALATNHELAIQARIHWRGGCKSQGYHS